MTTQGKLEKIEEAVNLDEVVKVAKIRQFNRFLRQGWVIPSVAAAGGIGVGVLVAKVLRDRKIVHIYEETDRQILAVKEEQLTLDFERAERDREFNKQIANASFLNEQLTKNAQELLNMLSHVKPQAVIGGEVTVPAPKEEAQEVPQPEPEAEQIPPEERPDGDRRLSKAVSKGRAFAAAVADKVEDAAEDVAEKVHNVFDNDDEWNYQAELMTRDPEKPYVIHVDEFVNDEMGYDNQMTLTYYAGDDVLLDSREKPMFKPENVVGDELKFGHGSGDPNVVYIRNERLQSEFEILRDPGKYTDMIAGEEIEREFETADLRHMNSPRRFRDD